MEFWQQLQELLSQAPGNAVYHLVTLFALQATLALSLSQWRRERLDHPAEPGPSLARRLALAAGALLLARFALLLISLLLAARGDRVLAVGILPPLEQAINTVTALLLVWSLTPPPPTAPRLPTVLAVLLLFLVGVMYAFFAQEWAASAGAGVTYNGSLQSTAWGIFQLVVLGAGALNLLFARPPGWLLRLSPLLVLLGAHLAQFWDYPELVPGDSEIPAWIRLGHLVALPLLAVIAYRHTLTRLLARPVRGETAAAEVADTLLLATGVLAASNVDNTLAAAARMAGRVTSLPFIGLALGAHDRPDLLQVSTLLGTAPSTDAARGAPHDSLFPGGRADRENARPQSWALNLNDWPAFRLAMEQERWIELQPEGMGSRQLHDLAQELGWPTPGPLHIFPLQVGADTLGVLLLGTAPGADAWSSSLHTVAPRLAAYVARALHNARAYEAARQDGPPLAGAPAEPVTGRVIAVEEERDRALARVESLEGRLQQSESRLGEAQQQVRNLAATVEVLEESPLLEERAALEAEIDALRASLIEAEEAMALAAAGEGELSTEWVMMTISRYSGELERAQARIGELEEVLQRQSGSETGELLTALAQELRTPLTSIAGYTDLLLGETMGILGTKQQEFLQRVKANVERMGVLLEQIVQLAAYPGSPARLTDVEQIALPELVDAAVNTVITQVRKKNLRLNLAIAEEIPAFAGNREAIGQILIHLLHNALQVSPSQDSVTVMAHTDLLQALGPQEEAATEHFIHLAIRDSGGGIPPADRAHVFDPQYRAENPLIEGVGDTGAGLSVAEALVAAHGGRIWVESEMGVGSTFTVLLPVGQNGNGAGPAAAAATGENGASKP